MKHNKIVKLISESRRRSKIYKTAIMESEKSFRELNSLNMQATLIQVEDFLESNNIYVYKNWLSGELWDGPNIHKYWVDFILRYDYDKMPDPRATMRLTANGAIIKFEEAEELVSEKYAREKDDLDPLSHKAKEIKRKMWLIHIRVPRNLIQDIDDEFPEEIDDITFDDNNDKLTLDNEDI